MWRCPRVQGGTIGSTRSAAETCCPAILDRGCGACCFCKFCWGQNPLFSPAPVSSSKNRTEKFHRWGKSEIVQPHEYSPPLLQTKCFIASPETSAMFLLLRAGMSHHRSDLMGKHDRPVPSWDPGELCQLTPAGSTRPHCFTFQHGHFSSPAAAAQRGRLPTLPRAGARPYGKKPGLGK